MIATFFSNCFPGFLFLDKFVEITCFEDWYFKKNVCVFVVFRFISSISQSLSIPLRFFPALSPNYGNDLFPEFCSKNESVVQF